MRLLLRPKMMLSWYVGWAVGKGSKGSTTKFGSEKDRGLRVQKMDRAGKKGRAWDPNDGFSDSGPGTYILMLQRSSLALIS